MRGVSPAGVAAFVSAVGMLAAVLGSLAAVMNLRPGPVPLGLAVIAFGLASAGAAWKTSPRGSAARHRWTLAGGAALALGSAAAAAAVARSPAVVGHALDLAGRAVLTVRLFLAGRLEYLDLDVAWTFLGLEAAALAVAVAWLVWRRGDVLWAWPPATALFLGEWLYYIDAAYEYALYFAVWAAGLQAALVAHRRAAGVPAAGRVPTGPTCGGCPGCGPNPSPDARPPSDLVFVVALAVAALVALGAHLVPGDHPPVSLGRVEDTMLEWMPFLRDLRGGGGTVLGRPFNLTLTGFAQQTLQLGGPVRLDPTTALELRFRLAGRPGEGPRLDGPRIPIPSEEVTDWPARLARPVLEAPLYLRGAVKDTYTGRGWTAGREDSRRHNPDRPLPSAVAGRVPTLQVELIIRPAALVTTSLFALWEPQQVTLEVAGGAAPDAVFVDAGYGLRAPRTMVRGTSYQVESRVPLWSLDHARTLWGANRAAQADAPESVRLERERALAPYLQLPLDLPERVRTRAQELTRGLENPVDKALAIEAYLRTYPYRLDPVPVPAGRDFVDWFLFDAPQGYCTYYASAMAVMLRSVGVPTRWVEGFLVPGADAATAQGLTDPASVRVVTVQNRNAHAWVEVFIEGYGWMPFEPTPAFTGPPRTAPPPLVPAALTGGGGAGGQATPRGDLPELPLGLEFGELDAGVETGPAAPRWSPGPLLAALARGLALALGLLAAGRLTLAYLALRRDERPDPRRPREAVVRLYARARRLLRRAHLSGLPGLPGGRPGDTPGAVVAQVARRAPDLAPAVARLTRTYEAARFGAVTPSPQALAEAAEAWRAVVRGCADRHGRFRTFWSHLL